MTRSVSFDIMHRGYFVATMTIPVPPSGTIDYDSITALVESRRPSLRGKPYTIAFNPSK